MTWFLLSIVREQLAVALKRLRASQADQAEDADQADVAGQADHKLAAVEHACTSKRRSRPRIYLVHLLKSSFQILHICCFSAI